MQPTPPYGAGRRNRAPLVIVIGTVVMAGLVAGAVAVYLTRPSGGPAGKALFQRDPVACSLLTLQQVIANVPGIVPRGSANPYHCVWGSVPDGPNLVTIDVETVNQFSRGSPDGAHGQFVFLRHQADGAGGTVTAQALGDESFMDCTTSVTGNACRVEVRVSNVVFGLRFDSFSVPAIPGRRDAATSAPALAALAVQNLRRQR